MNFDIIISGRGLVGASLACCLKNQNLKIAIIDKFLPALLGKKNARALALSPPSIKCLEMIDVWPKIAQEASAIVKVHVSKQKHFGVTEISAAQFKLPALGAVIDADILNHALLETLSSLPNVTSFCPDEIIGLSQSKDECSMQLSSGQHLTAKLLVAAEGAVSSLRKKAGIGVKVSEHEQSAIVANVQFEQPHQGVAFERFTENGSLALLPLQMGGMKCVWIVANPQLHHSLSLEKESFLKKIQEIFGFRLGTLLSVGERVCYPLRTVVADALYSDRLVLIGNSANNLHPIAAQGFNLGLRDAAILAEKIVDILAKDEEIGTIQFLQGYAKARENDHHQVRQGTQRLLEPSALQSLGILASEYFPALKHKIGGWGLGENTCLPKLCRGVKLVMNREAIS